MTISELIARLAAIQELEGDIPIFYADESGEGRDIEFLNLVYPWKHNQPHVEDHLADPIGVLIC